MVLRIYRWYKCWGAHPDSEAMVMEGMEPSRTWGFGFAERAKGRIVAWKDPLSIYESVFAMLFSTQITFRSSSQYFGIRYHLMVSKIIYYVAGMVDLPKGEEGHDMKKSWIHRFISIRFRIISPSKKSRKWSWDYTFKNSLTARAALTFSNSSASSSTRQKAGWLGSKTVTSCSCDPPSALIRESKIGRKLNASFPTS